MVGTESQTGLAARVCHRADAALQELTTARQRLAQRVLLRLVQFPEGDTERVTRRQQTRAALSAAGDDEGELESVIEHLVKRRLVTKNEGSELNSLAVRVDLAHEVLLTAWPTLKDWIQTRREDEQRRRSLEAKAREWSANGSGRTRLLDVEELAEARRWLAQGIKDLGISKDALALVDASGAAEATRQRRSKALRALLTILFLLAISGAWFAWEQRTVARQQLYHNVQEQARSALVERASISQAIARSREAIVLGGEGAVLRTLLGDVRNHAWQVTFFHRDRVLDSAFSLDGTRILTASRDGVAQIWDTETGRPLGRALLQNEPLTGVDISPDGSKVVAAFWRGTVRIWDAASGQLLRAWVAHKTWARDVSFSPDGSRVVTASKDGMSRIWDVQTGMQVGATLVHRGEIVKAAFSPDGSRLVTASKDGTAQIWSASTGARVGAKLRHMRDVVDASFSLDGKRVVTASWDRTARVWDAETGRPLGVPLAHKQNVSSAAFSPDGSRIVTTSNEKVARLWDAATGRDQAIHLEHEVIVIGAEFSPDGGRLVTASMDGAARIWNAASGRPLGAPLTHESGVMRAAFSADGAQVVTTSRDGSVRIWDAAAGTRRGVLLTHERAVWDAAFSSDGKAVVTAGEDGVARVWDATTGRLLGPSFVHGGSIRSVAFSPNSVLIATAGENRIVRVWEVATGRPVGNPLMHGSQAWSVAFSPDGMKVATADADGVVQVWDPQSGQALGKPLKHWGGATSVAFSPDGQRLVTSGNWVAQLWDITTGQLLDSSLAHDSVVMSAAYRWDGARIVTASWDGTARIWNASTGDPTGTSFSHEDALWSAEFSPDGTRVVTASRDQTARLWDAATGKQIGTPLVHDSAVRSAAFSPDGSRVVTASEDGTARIWEVLETGSLPEWSAQAARCVTQPRGRVSSARCSLFLRKATFEDKLSRVRSLVATGDARMPSRVWMLPRAAYQQALSVLDERPGASSGAERAREDALRELIFLRQAIVAAMEGDLISARARYRKHLPDAQLLGALGAAAHDLVYDDYAAIALLQQAETLAPAEPSILGKLAEAHIAAGELADAASAAARGTLFRMNPEQKVVLAALAWATARMAAKDSSVEARGLARAYAELPEAMRVGWVWKGTMHALTYGRYTAEESQPVIDVLHVLDESASAETRARLVALLAPRADARGATR